MSHGVLVVVPHMTAGTRLGDLLPLLEADHRVEVQFTTPTTADAWPGVEEYVRGWGVRVPWQQVVRTRFDLALAASYSEIDKIDAPVLVVPHGMGGGRSRRSPWTTAQDVGQVRPRDVLMRDGRVVPAAVAVAHESDARRCGKVAQRRPTGSWWRGPVLRPHPGQRAVSRPVPGRAGLRPGRRW